MKVLHTPTQTRTAGFSLMELIIVLMVIVTIAGIAMPRLGSASDRAHNARRVSDLGTLQKALELYHADHGVYPVVSGWSGDAPKYGGHGYTQKDPYIPGLIPQYIDMLPADPDPAYPTGSKGYLYKSDGKDYKVLAHQTPSKFPTDHRYFDSVRPTWAYQVSSANGADW